MDPSKIATLFDDSSNGICFDVSRDGIKSFNYSTVEAIKDGRLMTSKYHGKKLRFESKCIVVMANSQPNSTQLSMDRWVIRTIGSDLKHPSTDVPSIDPRVSYPFFPPPKLPDMSEDFELETFLMDEGFLASTTGTYTLYSILIKIYSFCI